MDTSDVATERSKAVIANYAVNLHKNGHLCMPSCLQKCGKLILSDESTSAGIVTCFKKDCGCRDTIADDEGDSEKLMRFQQDLRIEQLMMEREVKIAYMRHRKNQSGDDGLVYYEQFRNDLLDGIIRENVDREKREEAFMWLLSSMLLTVAALITFYAFRKVGGRLFSSSGAQADNFFSELNGKCEVS